MFHNFLNFHNGLWKMSPGEKNNCNDFISGRLFVHTYMSKGCMKWGCHRTDKCDKIIR